MATILKVQHGTDIRRLNITHFSTYAEFAQLVRTIFNISDLSGLKLMYQDEDHDFINIRSDLDMDEARRYAAQLPSFKIHALLADGISSSPLPAESAYPQLAPEDIDLTNSFCELLSESMQQKDDEQKEAKEQKKVEDGIPASSPEAAFHRSLDELSSSPDVPSSSDPNVLETVESKFKKALEALVEFVESLHLDAKVKQIVSELEPAFSKFETKVINPINDFGMRASQDFQVEVNQLRDRLNARFGELRSSPAEQPSTNAPAASAPASVVPPPPASLGHNAMQDLQQLESMGFTDRRRNLELLATHQGDLSKVIETLLA